MDRAQGVLVGLAGWSGMLALKRVVMHDFVRVGRSFQIKADSDGCRVHVIVGRDRF